MSHSLRGRVALVTGGFGELGSAIADRMTDHGATVMRSGRHPGDMGVTHDVTDADSWGSVVTAITEAHGQLDVPVNAAGTLGSSEQTVLSANVAQWHDLYDVHVVGPWLGCREIIRRQPTTPVSIVNVSSTAGLNATPGMVAYGAAKDAVAHLTASVALYAARAGLPVRCNAVAPALVDGGMRDDVLSTIATDASEALAAYLSRVPIGRLVRPNEIADAVCFLAGEAPDSLTGQVLVIAGGLGLA
jgi:3(or 17)beta-hydroxysteroid dehydrogenase